MVGWFQQKILLRHLTCDIWGDYSCQDMVTTHPEILHNLLNSLLTFPKRRWLIFYWSNFKYLHQLKEVSYNKIIVSFCLHDRRFFGEVGLPFFFFLENIESWIFMILTTFFPGIWKFAKLEVYFTESTLTLRLNENKLKSSSSVLYANLDKGNNPAT